MQQGNTMVIPSAQTVATSAQPQPKRRGSKQFRSSSGFSSPRRFNDKIAFQQMRQAQHEKLFNEVNTHVHSFNAAGGRPMLHGMAQAVYPSGSDYCFASHAQNTAAAAAPQQTASFNQCTPAPHQQQLFGSYPYADHYGLGGNAGYLQSPAAVGAGAAPVGMHFAAAAVNNFFVYPEPPVVVPGPQQQQQPEQSTGATQQHASTFGFHPAPTEAGVYMFCEQQQGPHGNDPRLSAPLQPRTKRMYSSPDIDVYALPVATPLSQQGAPKLKLERRRSLDNLLLSTSSKPVVSPMAKRQPQTSRRASHGSLHSGRRASQDSGNTDKLENLLSVLLSRDPSAQAQQHRPQQQHPTTLYTPPSCPQLSNYTPTLQPLTPTTPPSQMTTDCALTQHVRPSALARPDQLGHIFGFSNVHVPSPIVDTTTASVWGSLPPTPLDTSPLSTPNSTEDAAFILDLTRLTELHMAGNEDHMNIDTSTMINFSAADVDRLFPKGFC